jgi:hypothetical protein
LPKHELQIKTFETPETKRRKRPRSSNCMSRDIEEETNENRHSLNTVLMHISIVIPTLEC